MKNVRKMVLLSLCVFTLGLTACGENGTVDEDHTINDATNGMDDDTTGTGPVTDGAVNDIGNGVGDVVDGVTDGVKDTVDGAADGIHDATDSLDGDDAAGNSIE